MTVENLYEVIQKLRGKHADKIFVAENYSIADLIRDLTELDKQWEYDLDRMESYARDADRYEN